MNIIRDKLLFSLLLMFFLTIFSYHTTLIYSGYQDVHNNESLNKTNYVQSPSIKISSNEDFLNLNFPGTGTLTDPYIISSINFTEINANMIAISKTDAYFVIEDCIINIEDPDNDGVFYSGIILDGVQNGIIRNNKFFGSNIHSREAIYVVSSSDIIIRENIFQETDLSGTIFNHQHEKGIRIDSSSDIEIIGNSIDIYGLEAILVTQSDSLLVQANSLHAHFSDGMIFGGSNSKIINNNFTNNNRYGLALWYDNANNLISENNFINNRKQISVTGMSNQIVDNHWSDLVEPDINNDGIVDISYDINTELTTGWVNLTDNSPHIDSFIIKIPTDSTLDAFSTNTTLVTKETTSETSDVPQTTSFDFLLFSPILCLIALIIRKR